MQTCLNELVYRTASINALDNDKNHKNRYVDFLDVTARADTANAASIPFTVVILGTFKSSLVPQFSAFTFVFLTATFPASISTALTLQETGPSNKHSLRLIKHPSPCPLRKPSHRLSKAGLKSPDLTIQNCPPHQHSLNATMPTRQPRSREARRKI